VVEQIAPIAAVMNATSVHSLQQRTTPSPLSCPGLTPCVSSRSSRTILRLPEPNKQQRAVRHYMHYELPNRTANRWSHSRFPPGTTAHTAAGFPGTSRSSDRARTPACRTTLRHRGHHLPSAPTCTSQIHYSLD